MTVQSYLNAPKLTVACLIALALTHAPHARAAETQAQMAHQEGDVGENAHDLVQGSHVEGHIAFLKAELAITPAQEVLWEPVASAMREDVRNLQDADARIAHDRSQHSAIGYLENRVMFANLRAQGEDRFLTAFKPLYANLTRQQREVAESLLVPDAPDAD